MKFSKLTKKLLLSALSLGLAVVTLTTTTYAWYTSSTDANASAQGTTSGTTTDSTLMISSNYKIGENVNQDATWAKTATVTASADTLKPVAWNGTKFVNINGTEEGVNATDYYQFKLWFKTTKTDTTGGAIKVYLNNLKIANKATSALTTYDNLLAAATGQGTLTDDTYAVDVVRALDLLVGTKAYELSDQFKYAQDAEGNSYEKGIDDESNALTYYNSVMGTTLSNTDDFTEVTVSKADASLGEILEGTQYVEIGEIAVQDAAYTVLEVTFTVFLNGWDQYCFDACKGQSFTVDLAFTTVAKNN